jgi:hypothetical protein
VKLNEKKSINNNNHTKRRESKKENKDLTIEEFLMNIFDNKKKLSKSELKRKYLKIKNIIKFSTRTDKAVDIKKLTRLNFEREKIDINKIDNNNINSANLSIGNFTKNYKEERKSKCENNHKNGIFSVNSSFLSRNNSNSNYKFEGILILLNLIKSNLIINLKLKTNFF